MKVTSDLSGPIVRVVVAIGDPAPFSFGRAKSVVQGAFTQLEACRASILFLLATASFRPLKLCTSSVGIFFGVLSAPVRLVFL